ncbi:ABC transporter ATP-binding protein [Eggerthella sinensis]|uniref:ABC transporter ATP-binding protein n=1 Tax=Eggerthella sinensis TaxID=242230 RepID=UPI00248DEFD2|nr:ABC transporter ATP-binding protein [Eggerthella sinensis]
MESQQTAPGSVHSAAPDGGMKPLERLWAFAAPHKALYFKSIALSVAGVACGFLPYAAVAVIAASLIGGVRDLAFYLFWCAVAAAGQVAKAMLMGWSTTTSHKATFAVLSEVRRALAEKLNRMPLGYVLETPSGKLKAPFVERAEQLEVPLAHVVPELTANLLVPLGIVVVLFFLDWRMALISLVTIPVGMLCYAVEMRDYAVKYGRVVAAKNHMGATIVEYIGGIEVIKAFGRSASSYAKFTDAVRANSGLMLDWMRATLPWTAIMMSVWPAVLIGVLPLGCVFLMDGSLDAGTFIAIVVLALGIMGPLFAAIMFTDEIAKITTIVGEIGTVLDQVEMNRPAEPRALEGCAIKLEGVTFSYGDEPVLRGVDLEIPAGSMTALVGPSGSGKSTIAKLIASQWDAASGAVSLGGVDERELPLSQVAESIAYVAQDNYLFDDTVMNNIRMGRAAATDDEVVACAKASGCHEFIEGLEHGYQTVVGGSGGHLSGGERQRIAIARAMLKDAPIVILDEATAYTDPENEAIVQRAVARLTEGKTLIVIAHRLSTVTGADRIAVVDGGRVIACDAHESLLETCPLYAQMWNAHESARDAA